MLIASFDTPVRSGRSRTRTPFSSRTRTTLALIASDRSDSRSNSMANASSTRERSAAEGDGNRCLFAPGRRPPLAIRPSAEQSVPQDRETVGQVDVNLADQRPQRFPKLVDLVLAEARLPALLDGAEQRPPHLLSLAGLWGWRESPRRSGAALAGCRPDPVRRRCIPTSPCRSSSSWCGRGPQAHRRVTPSSPTNRMQFDHITSDTSQGTWREPAVEPWFVVRCGICRSNSLSNSMVNATSTWESRVDKGRPAERAPPLLEDSAWAGDGIEGVASRASPFRRLRLRLRSGPSVGCLGGWRCARPPAAHSLAPPGGQRPRWG